MSKLQELIQRLCPNGVEYKTIEQIGSFYGGLTGKSKEDFVGGNAKFITYLNIYTNPSLSLDIKDRVRVAFGENQNIVKYGDILFTGSSETPDECGMSSVLTQNTNEPLYLNSFCFGLRLESVSAFNLDFLKHLFRSVEVRKQITKTANGVTRFNISKKLFAKIRIPVPPREIQDEIAKILDRFSDYAAELQAELQARKEQYEYYRNLLLTFNPAGCAGEADDEQEGSVTTRGGHSYPIQWKTMGEIGKIKMCKRIMKAQTTNTGDIPFYKIGTFGKKADAFISRELFNEYKRLYSYPRKGTILVSASGTIGRCVVYEGEDAYYQDSNIVWLDNDESIVLNTYLYHYYQIVNWNTEGGTIKRLYNDCFASTPIPVPPLELQEKIVAVLDRFETLVNDLSEGLPAEIAAVKEQYEYYRNRLLTFKEKTA